MIGFIKTVCDWSDVILKAVQVWVQTGSGSDLEEELRLCVLMRKWGVLYFLLHKTGPDAAGLPGSG